MSLSVLICDDSAMARRLLARSLPEMPSWTINYAENGEAALDFLSEHSVDLLFLDLNMPGLTGFDVLAEIRKQDYGCMTIVVSGDVQETARERVIGLGAMDFVRKPANRDIISKVLTTYGILPGDYQPASADSPSVSAGNERLPVFDFSDAIREVVNVAMGEAGSYLSDMLGTFVGLPVPKVVNAPFYSLPDSLPWDDDIELSATSHGFKGRGVAGEGVLLMPTKELEALRDWLGVDQVPSRDPLTGTLDDVSELLLGACLSGISQQLDLPFNHSFPVLLGHRRKAVDLLNCQNKAETVLGIGINYRLQEPPISCYLQLLVTEESIGTLVSRVAIISEELKVEVSQ
ncbi:response regulator [Pseudohongiella nitratireducens]|uniref:Response regulator n=1 Tax=Pseudohongiella nitratireducens TaxID=1768907 RepID=A0A917GJU7_9GAMM|nr:response regulator [Pseudohongiella nitratireducens]GGG48212.1 response regulator [Pseudohongiella nitratireducens]